MAKLTSARAAGVRRRSRSAPVTWLAWPIMALKSISSPDRNIK
jgi:hypothetical protein